MSGSQLFDILNTNFRPAEEFTTDKQKVFRIPSDSIHQAHASFFPESNQINVHAIELRGSKSALVNLLLADQALGALTSVECESDIPISFSWVKYFARPSQQMPRSWDIIPDEVIEIALTSQHIGMMAQPNTIAFGKLAIASTQPSRRMEASRATIVHVINEALLAELSDYFRCGMTSYAESNLLPPPADLGTTYSMPTELRQHRGMANLAFDSLEETQTLLQRTLDSYRASQKDITALAHLTAGARNPDLGARIMRGISTMFGYKPK